MTSTRRSAQFSGGCILLAATVLLGLWRFAASLRASPVLIAIPLLLGLLVSALWTAGSFWRLRAWPVTAVATAIAASLLGWIEWFERGTGTPQPLAVLGGIAALTVPVLVLSDAVTHGWPDVDDG